jgi:hypothetical protein
MVFIHGIGRPKDPEIQRIRWLDAISQGMTTAGYNPQALADPAQVRTTYVNYADLVNDPGAMGSAPDDLTVEEIDFLVGYLAEVLQANSRNPPDAETGAILREALSTLTYSGQAQGLGDMVRRLLNTLSTMLEMRVSEPHRIWLVDKLLLADLAHVAIYLNRKTASGADASIDARIRARLHEALDDSPAIVIAHSLGSVVAYEALHETATAVPLWITLGSPLGMRAVVLPRLRPTPPTTPETVERWLNYWDRDDVIVPRPNLANFFASNEALVGPESRLVRSKGAWVHSVHKYLAQPDVCEPLAETLISMGVDLR